MWLYSILSQFPPTKIPKHFEKYLKIKQLIYFVDERASLHSSVSLNLSSKILKICLQPDLINQKLQILISNRQGIADLSFEHNYYLFLSPIQDGRRKKEWRRFMQHIFPTNAPLKYKGNLNKMKRKLDNCTFITD